jgi:hypothetical protein
VTAQLAASALFYPRALVRTQLLQLVAGILDDPSLDIVQFDGAGGTAERELAIPFLPAMDEVVVSDASLELEARPLELELAQSDYTVSQPTGVDAGKGVIVRLKRPGRLTRLVVDDPDLPSNVHVVVRPAEPNAAPGPPIFAAEPFTLDSTMYAPVLGGLTVTPLSGGKVQLTFPQTAGSGWLIQFATGDEATKLAALGYSGTVSSVRVAAAPTNLTLVVPGADGADDTVLWSYANALLPEVGSQSISFAPVAQKELAAALGRAADVTLPLQLRFHSDTGGKIGIRSKTLTAQYLVRPLGPDPVQRRLGGAWSTLRLDAPAARRPAKSELQLTARHLGRALNDGSPLPPTELPAAGVRVDRSSWAATSVRFESADGGDLPLVAVQVPLEATAEAEVSLEVRASAAGAPAAPLGPPVVRQLGGATAPGAGPGAVSTRDWVEFELAQPLTLATGGDGYWVSLRTTKGEVRWFASGAGAARVSIDQGETWGEVDPTLLDASAPLALLFHAVPPPFPAPRIELQLGASPAGAVTPSGPAADDPASFTLSTTALPPAVLDAVARTSGTGRAPTEVLVFSRAGCDLTVESLTLLYDPVAG